MHKKIERLDQKMEEKKRKRGKWDSNERVENGKETLKEKIEGWMKN